MKVVVSPKARQKLSSQIDYLIDRNSLQAAERLQDRVMDFLTGFLVRFPRTGRFIHKLSLWEIPVARTKLIIWYCISDEAIEIVDVWHGAQDRFGDPDT